MFQTNLDRYKIESKPNLYILENLTNLNKKLNKTLTQSVYSQFEKDLKFEKYKINKQFTSSLSG